MVDALAPALNAFKTSGIAAAARAARAGAEATAAMRKAKAGRSSYLGDQQLLGIVDPGAHAVAEVFAALEKVPEVS